MTEKTALQYKELGNQQFKEKNYQQALKYYTQAIQLDPTNSIFYSNRARTYRVLNDDENSYKDAQKAIQLDDKNIKGYYLMGETLVSLAMNSKDPTQIQDAIDKLKKSLTLCPSQGKAEFQEKFIDEIYNAKKQLWILRQQIDLQKKRALQKYLINLVQTDTNLPQTKKDEYNQKIQLLLQKNLKTEKVKIPQPLICPITKTLMKDPVCNEHGNSYSKLQYLGEIKSNGNIDPISKKVIKTNILYPNINIKKAIENFLQKHPWAYNQINNQ